MKAKESDPQSKTLRDEAVEWWVRLDGAESDSETRRRFDQWLSTSVQHRKAFDEICGFWGELSALQNNADTQDRFFQPRLRTLGLGLAACMLLALLLGPLSVLWNADYRTGAGETRSVRLADGSLVKLAGASALAVDITSEYRRLRLLQGEAWFQVFPDPTRPFQVKAGGGTVTALGTAFDIRHTLRDIQVTVTEHTVALDLENADAESPPLTLTTGQQIRYSKLRPIGAIRSVDINAATAWRRGSLVFENLPLAEVVEELNRYHTGQILVAGSALGQRRVNGVFSTDDPLTALSTLENALHLHSTRLGDYLIVLHE